MPFYTLAGTWNWPGLPDVRLGTSSVPLGPLRSPAINLFDGDDPNTADKTTIKSFNWPLTPGGEPRYVGLLLGGWFAVLAGVLVHLAVTTAKAGQAGAASPSALAVAQFTPRVNAFFGPILMKLLLALFAFFGLAFASDLATTTYLSFFLAGYTLDSVVDLFGTTLEKRGSAQLSGLQQQLAATAGTGPSK